MNKLIALAVTCTLAGGLLAVETPPFDLKQKPRTEEERQARRAYIEKRMYERTGGKLVRPGTQLGEVVYVNCQSAADPAWIEESAEYFRKESKFRISVQPGEFDFAKPAIRGQASLFIVDDPALPGLLSAPEDRWALVNVAKLKSEKPQFFAARVKKELTRGFAFLCGASNSSYPEALTGGIRGAADLDVHVDHRLPVDVLARFAVYMQPFGVSPAVIATYRKACQEGWAPAPTNDIQKAIVEQVKKEREETLKGPINPQPIKFDPAKGE